MPVRDTKTYIKLTNNGYIVCCKVYFMKYVTHTLLVIGVSSQLVQFMLVMV